MPLNRLVLGAVIVLAGLVLVASVYQGSPDRDESVVHATAGRVFAERTCASCHAVGLTGASPVAVAPPFRTFARLWPLESIEEALAEGMSMDHPTSPEFTLTPRQINNFIAYLETIQQ